METSDIACLKGVQNSTIGGKSDETFLELDKGQFLNTAKRGAQA
jgi:hypothetical protein